jgi:hypothetical protein
LRSGHKDDSDYKRVDEVCGLLAEKGSVATRPSCVGTGSTFA